MASLRQQAAGVCSFLPSCQLQAEGRRGGSEQRHFKRQRGRFLRGRLSCDCSNNKSNGKQVQETVSTWSRNWLLPATMCNPQIAGLTLHAISHHQRNLSGLSWWLSGQEPSCQRRGRGFDPWVRKISWRRKRQPTPVFSRGKSNGKGAWWVR